MNRTAFDAHCATLRHATNVVQWGGCSVWKIGGKIFALCSPEAKGEGFVRISFKCSDMAYEILRDEPGIIPAPHLARAKWVQLQAPDAMDDDDIRQHLDAAHAMIASRLTRKLRTELGFLS
ncbi:MmcQ/YjbR family DNA-binding protein [uncultured Cohaesibacter sp.]|uniref:MmcQ/YjbR family DNA-binding protein n=1 Tax=uncultured Cohaesibacter sp. TaxID=1002546 RepID=UPI0029C696A1|nr:MmcQ/YjbR family DNA-binding protein [uncultured Cohaesibacter sp.]